MRTLGASGAILRASTLALLAALLSSGAHAAGDDILVNLEGTAHERKPPKLIVKVNKDLASAVLELTADGRRHRDAQGPMKQGGSLTFELPHEEVGKKRWQGSLSVRFADGAGGEMPLGFETERVTLPHIRILSSKDEILQGNKIAVEMNRPAAKVDVEVYGDEGRLLANTSRSFDGAPAGTRLEVSWVPAFEGPPLRVKVTAWDTNDVYISNESYPWTLSIPHEEVVFETGKAEIRPAEEPKLKAALSALRSEVKRYAKAVAVDDKRIHLFVAGHTDRVGSPEHNRALSKARARAIAAWFRRAGVQLPVYYRGFGEDLPKVATPDETDEPQNRRADYNIAVEPPTGSFEGWTRL